MTSSYQGTRSPDRSNPNRFRPTSATSSNFRSEVEIAINADSLSEYIKPVEFDRAMEQTEIGKFNIVTILLCGSIITLSYLLPSAFIQLATVLECQFQLGLDEKNFINQVTYTGMIVGTVLIGASADYFGRKSTLVCALIIYFFGVVIGSCSTTYTWLGICRMITSFSISGASCIALVILAEFALPQHRAPALCSMQLFWMVGTILVPTIGTGWESAIVICAISAIIIISFIWMILPETPRYLLTNYENENALDSIKTIYTTNTGMDPNAFPCKTVVDNPTYEELSTRMTHTVIPPYMKPPCFSVPALLILNFLLMFCYYTLAVWYNELSLVSRYESFFNIAYDLNPLAETCQLRNYYDLTLKENYNQNTDTVKTNHTIQQICNSTSHVTLEDSNRQIILTSFSSVPAIIILMMSIDTLGRNFFIAFGQAGVAVLCYGSYFVITTRYEVLFTSLFQAMCTFSVAGVYCVAVEVLSTKRRVFGLSLVVAGGQLGAVLGNWGLASMFDIACAYLLSGISICVFTSTLLTLVLPDTIGMTLRQ